MIFSRIKNLLRDTAIWIKISHSSWYQRIRNPNAYSAFLDEMKFFRSLFNEERVKLIFDVGANVGNKSFIFSRLAYQVLAFEPSEKCIRILKARFGNSNVNILNNALGRISGHQDFYLVKNNEAYNSFSKKHIDTTLTKRHAAGANDIEIMKISVDTLDHFMGKYGIPDYIKIDVEGFEIDVIMGLTKPVSLISFEANFPDFKNETIEIINYLSKLSNDSYLYNISVEGPFLFESGLRATKVIDFLKESDLRYLEVYAKLEPVN